MASTPASAAGADTELTRRNWNDTLYNLPASTPAVIEFYASWCPHCRYFAPTWAKVSAFFNQTYPELNLFVAKLDCAANPVLCYNQGVEGYPRIHFSLDVHNFHTGDNNSITQFPGDSRSTAPEVVAWIGTQLNKTLVWKEPQIEAKDSYFPAVEPPLLAPWSVQDIESATIDLYEKLIIANPLNIRGAEKRAAIVDLLKLWAVSSPAPRCKQGAANLLAELPKLWPVNEPQARPEIANTKICMDAEINWNVCKSSYPHARGFTCGMWLSFHTLSVRLPAKNPAEAMLSFLRAFNNNFFDCLVCQSHFAEVLAAAPKMDTEKEVAMWLWRSHNEVNARLSREETRGGYVSSGDPDFPKVQWPTKCQCPSCWSKSEDGKDVYNEDAIYKFMKRVYSDAGDNNVAIFADPVATKSGSIKVAGRKLFLAKGN